MSIFTLCKLDTLRSCTMTWFAAWLGRLKMAINDAFIPVAGIDKSSATTSSLRHFEYSFLNAKIWLLSSSLGCRRDVNIPIEQVDGDEKRREENTRNFIYLGDGVHGFAIPLLGPPPACLTPPFRRRTTTIGLDLNDGRLFCFDIA